jgi:hypothetical protein
VAGQPAVKVTGAVEFQRALGRMRGSLEDRAFHQPPAEAARDRVLERVPRVTGDLADTVAIVPIPGGVEIVAGSPLVPYAGVINYGWDAHGIEAQHFLDGGLEDSAAAIHDAYAAEVDALVERVGRES